MQQKFRDSEFIDFNTGTVKIAPLQLQYRQKMAGPPQFADHVRLFACRVEVWHLGVAAQIVNGIEFSLPPEVWAHAAYGLFTLLVPYFEMVGQIVRHDTNTAATQSKPDLAAAFALGFRDVYADLTTTSGEHYNPLEFYARIRHGLFVRGSTTAGLWMHNSSSFSTKDFDIIQKDANAPETRKHYINPHGVVRTVIDHFPTLLARLSDPAAEYEGMRTRFGDYVSA